MDAYVANDWTLDDDITEVKLDHIEQGIASVTDEVLLRGAIGYAQVTAAQNNITVEADLTNLTATVTVPAGRLLRITGVAPWSSTVAGTLVQMKIKEGSSQLQMARMYIDNDATTRGPLPIAVLVGAAAGTHTYKLTAGRLGTTEVLTMPASTTNPAYILVEDLGPAA